MDATEKVRRNIVKIRKEKDFTQERLAYESGVSKGYLCEVESGKKSPTVRILGKLAETLEIETWRLLK